MLYLFKPIDSDRAALPGLPWGSRVRLVSLTGGRAVIKTLDGRMVGEIDQRSIEPMRD